MKRCEFAHFYTAREMVNSKGETITVKEPRVTVCYLRMATDFLHAEPWTAIGIAICSAKDHPCKKVGRAIAKQRAEHAAFWNTWGLPIQRPEVQGYILQLGVAEKALISDLADFRIKR